MRVTVTTGDCPRLFDLLTTLTFGALRKNHIVSTAFETITKKKKARRPRVVSMNRLEHTRSKKGTLREKKSSDVHGGTTRMTSVIVDKLLRRDFLHYGFLINSKKEIRIKIRILRFQKIKQIYSATWSSVIISDRMVFDCLLQCDDLPFATCALQWPSSGSRISAQDAQACLLEYTDWHVVELIFWLGKVPCVCHRHRKRFGTPLSKWRSSAAGSVIAQVYLSRMDETSSSKPERISSSECGKSSRLSIPYWTGWITSGTIRSDGAGTPGGSKNTGFTAAGSSGCLTTRLRETQEPCGVFLNSNTAAKTIAAWKVDQEVQVVVNHEMHSILRRKVYVCRRDVVGVHRLRSTKWFAHSITFVTRLYESGGRKFLSD